MTTSIRVESRRNFSNRDKLRLASIVELMSSVLNSQAFQDKVLAGDFRDRRFKDRAGVVQEIGDNKRILELILNGEEQLGEGGADAVWSLDLKLIRGIGFIGRRVGNQIQTRKRWFRRNSNASVAGHWIHEYLHVLGFIHDYDRTARRDFSVPYLVGYIAEEVAREGDFTPASSDHRLAG